MTSTNIPDAKAKAVSAVADLRVERQRRAARRMAIQTIELFYRLRSVPVFMPQA